MKSSTLILLILLPCLLYLFLSNNEAFTQICSCSSSNIQLCNNSPPLTCSPKPIQPIKPTAGPIPDYICVTPFPKKTKSPLPKPTPNPNEPKIYCDMNLITPSILSEIIGNGLCPCPTPIPSR